MQPILRPTKIVNVYFGVSLLPRQATHTSRNRNQHICLLDGKIDLALQKWPVRFGIRRCCAVARALLNSSLLNASLLLNPGEQVEAVDSAWMRQMQLFNGHRWIARIQCSMLLASASGHKVITCVITIRAGCLHQR